MEFTVEYKNLNIKNLNKTYTNYKHNHSNKPVMEIVSNIDSFDDAVINDNTYIINERVDFECIRDGFDYVIRDNKVTNAMIDEDTTDYKQMFINCKNTRLVFSKSINYNTEITSMNEMFAGTCVKYIDMTNLYTGNITDMSGMFADSCVESINFMNNDVSQVETLEGLFDYHNPNYLNLVSFKDNHKLITPFSLVEYRPRILTLHDSNITTINDDDDYDVDDNEYLTSIKINGIDISGVCNDNGTPRYHIIYIDNDIITFILNEQ